MPCQYATWTYIYVYSFLLAIRSPYIGSRPLPTYTRLMHMSRKHMVLLQCLYIVGVANQIYTICVTLPIDSKQAKASFFLQIHSPKWAS